MVQIKCIEAGCLFETQDFPFEFAEKLLDKHLQRKHPLGYNLVTNDMLDQLFKLSPTRLPDMDITPNSRVEEKTSFKRTKRKLHLDVGLEEDKDDQEHQTDEMMDYELSI